MKRLTLLLAMAIICLTVTAQDQKDTTSNQVKDTIRVGSMTIVKEGKNKNGKDKTDKSESDHKHKKPRNLSTNWGIIDFGLSNYNDRTNYSNAGSYLVNRPGYPALGENDFKLRTEKSINFNIWFFMQRLNLVKHYVNLKYGLGLEFNKYYYKIYDNIPTISYREGGTIPYSGGAQTTSPFIFRDSIAFSKNKLKADYLTVPLMLNFVSNPRNNKRGVSLSLGISGSYLYSQKNKQTSDERGCLKNKGDYDMERFKFSYIAELGLGPIRLYGSYSPNSMYERDLDIRPYTVGFRFSNW
jgi:hypothetical protein